MSSQVSQHELFTSLNGYLLRICIKPTTNDSTYSIDLEQFEYDLKNKLFNIHFRDISLKKSKLKYDQDKAKFFILEDRLGRQNSNNQSLILVGEFHDKQRIFRSFNVISFNEISKNFTIENEISEKITNTIALLEEKNSKLLLENIQISLNIPSKTYLICNLEMISNELFLNINRSNNLANESEKLFLFKPEYENFKCVTWLEVSDHDRDFENILNQKCIFIIKISNKNNESKQVKCFIFDCYNQSTNQINGKKLFGNFLDRTLSKSSLFEENAKMDFSSLNQCFFNMHMTLPSSSNEKQLNLVSISVLDYSLKFQNQCLELDGDCILLLSDSLQFYICFLKNGNLFSKITSNSLYKSLKVIDQPWSDENSEESKYLLFQDDAQAKYDLYTLNSNQTTNKIKRLREINAIFVGYDLFLVENDTCQFLVIKNWINNLFEVIENFSSNIYSEDFNLNDQDASAMELGEDFETMNISLTDQQSMITKENVSDKQTPFKKDFQRELLKILENKKHTCELLLNEALMETKFKHSLLIEITNECSQENTTKIFSLPKTIELYTNRFEFRREDSSRLKNEKIPLKTESYFKLESTWSTWIDQNFLINFVFLNKSK